jgi:hypothetical protein
VLLQMISMMTLWQRQAESLLPMTMELADSADWQHWKVFSTKGRLQMRTAARKAHRDWLPPHACAWVQSPSRLVENSFSDNFMI